eukprot:1940746-Amphidinium_carterae.1
MSLCALRSLAQLLLQPLCCKRRGFLPSFVAAAMPVITVIPASSNSGAQAVNSLLTGDFASKAKVRAAVRSAEKGAITFKDVAENPDFELISGIDASSSETLSTAFVGADYAVIVTPHDDSRGMADAAADAAMTANMINAAKEAGVKHIVYVGSLALRTLLLVMHTFVGRLMYCMTSCLDLLLHVYFELSASLGPPAATQFQVAFRHTLPLKLCKPLF